MDIASNGEFTEEEESYVDIIYSGRPSVYFVKVADEDKAKLLELEIKNKSPRKHSKQPLWLRDHEGEIFFSPKGVRNLSQEWGEWAKLPMEPSITGAASSVVLNKAELEKLLSSITTCNPELGRALREHILPMFKDFILEVDITAKFHSSYEKIPSQAKQWEVRSKTGWPTMALVRKVKNAGVRFAPKVNKASGHLDKDFRMDFAQDILMEDYTHYQKVVVILKDLGEVYIKQDVKDFKSFFFKTALVWERQKAGTVEPPAHVMLVNTLDHLLEAFKEGILQDYFEPELNLLAVMDMNSIMIAAAKLQEVKHNLSSYLSNIAGRPMLASRQLAKIIEVMHRAPLNSQELMSTNIKSLFNSFLSKFYEEENLLKLGKGVVKTFQTKHVPNDIKKQLSLVLSPYMEAFYRTASAVSASPLPAAKPAKEPPKWLTETLPFFKDHDAARGREEPELPNKDIINFIIFQFIQWIGFRKLLYLNRDGKRKNEDLGG